MATPQQDLKLHRSVVQRTQETIATRRFLHQIPETSYEEYLTSEYVAKELAALGIEVTTGVGKTGVVGLLRGSSLEPCIALRADMDGLPVVEATGLEFASRHEGRMHACGHDGHMAILLCVARILAGQRDTLKGSVKFLFQPAEEGGAGAKAMIEDGCMENPTVSEIYGLHLWSYDPVGIVSAKMGPLMAASDKWQIDIEGVGGHGAVPEGTVDAVYVGAQVVLALHSIVARNVAPLDNAVLTVGTFHGGFSENVIAETCRLNGTARTYKPETQDLMERRMNEVCSGVGATYGAKVLLNYKRCYPATVNTDVDAVDRVTRVAADVVGDDNIHTHCKTMAAEDFSFYLQMVPGCFFFVGSAPDTGKAYPHHKPTFDIDERAMDVGASILLSVVEELLIK